MNVRGKRNIGRKILAVALSVCMLLTVQPNLWDGVMVQAAEVVNGTLDGTNLAWTLANGVMTISGSGAMTDFTYGNYKDSPFYLHRNSIKKVVIEDGVTSIGSRAFADCDLLTDVTIADSVENIGVMAFNQCTALVNVGLPREMTSIGKQAFNLCENLESFVIPEGVTSIEDYTFSSCSSLKNVIIPEGVTSIGWQAFCDCSSLENVTIPNSVTSIKEQAFVGCALREVTIPENVTSIGYNAFEECSRLGTVTFQGTTTIPTLDNQYGGVFAGCQFVTKSTKGIHVPSCQYLSQEGWSDYKSYIADAPHTQFSYAADGAVITQSCANCDEQLGTATISVDSGADLNYTGSEIKPAKVTYSDSWVEDNNKPDNTAITYENNIDAGTATAKLTIGGATAQINFTIKAVSYTVTLNGNGGKGGTALSSYTLGTETALPADWTKTGYVFDGWYDNEGCAGIAVTEIPDTAAGDKEYWAKWTDNIAPVIGTITYNYSPTNLWQWLIGKDSLVITVPVTEEGSGADEITYTVTPDGEAAREETAPVQNGRAEITVSADFKGTISIVCADNANNTSASVTVGAGLDANGIIIENHAPEIAFQAANVELLNTGEYKTAPDITVTVTDNKDNAISAGIAPVRYKIGNGNEKTVAHDYTTSMVVNDSFTIPAGEIPAGETKITVTATDNAGNSNMLDYTVKVHTHSGTLVPAVEPACTTAGNITYYICSCGKWFSDSGCTNEITDHTTVIRNALGHDYTWTIKAPNMTAEVTATGVCKNNNSHTETKTLPALTDTTAWTAGDKTEPKKDTDGSQTYTSQYGTVTVTFPSYTKIVEKVKAVAEDTLKKVTATNHTTKENIQNEIHTVLTNAGIQDVTVTVEDLTITEATSSAAGSISGNITISSGSGNDRVTDHVSINMTIAKLTEGSGSSSGSSDSGTSTPQPPKNTGTITKDVEKTDTAPDTRISGNEAELADILLTTEEKSKVENGTDIRVILDIKDAQNLVDSSDQAVVEETLSGSTSVQGYDVGQYLDVSLYKVVGTERTAISETSKKIRIVIQVPDALKSKDSGTSRTFAVIRVHSGAAEVLKDLDDDADTITIETDRFSAYVIVYKEGAAAVKPDTKPAKNASAKEKRNSQLHSGLKAVPEGNMLQISWGSVSGADGYDVYVQYCGKKFNAGSRSVVKGGKKTTFTINKVNGKAVDTKKKIKIYVVAWQQKNGKKTTLAKSLTTHIAGKDDAAYTNVKRIQVKKSSYTLEKGKDVTLAPTAVLYDKKKKQLSNNHAKEFRYLSSNQNVATVTAGGKVKAKGIGSCTIYIIARNGCSKKIQITVTE